MGGLPAYAAAKALAEAHRFWSKVAPSDDAGCRIWLGASSPRGYGMYRMNGGTRTAHRAAYELAHGISPAGYVVCHRCDTPACVNPAHLFLGTQADNMRDMIAKGRKVQLRGAAKPEAVLTEETVRAIRASLLGPRPAGRAFGVSHTTIMSVRSRKLWAHVE